MKTPAGGTALFWFRRDLRVTDNAGLYRALTAATRVHCVFVFDRGILEELPSRCDRRVEFIWESVAELKRSLQALGGDLIVCHAFADSAVPGLAQRLKVTSVFANEDYEPSAMARDVRVRAALAARGIDFQSCKDTVIFGKDEILTQSGGPYSVFTPYKNAWLKKVNDFYLKAYPVRDYACHLAAPGVSAPMPSLESIGFARTNLGALGIEAGESGAHALLEDFVDRIGDYQRARDFPAVKGGSCLSIHNRFGTISIRQLASIAYARTLRKKDVGAETWLSELIWRDFYFQILYHHPRVARSAFRVEYDAIQWPNDPALFAAWCEARTGYPIIDAAMRQLNETGAMHNRLRMIVASFLTKDLLVDWRRGESYFASRLNDFDLAANNGGWQWAASTGCDAQPYFRIFNPVTQSERFDPGGEFIRTYLPELVKVPDKFIHAPWTLPSREQASCGITIGTDYPVPVVDHAVQRAKALAMYRAAKG
jgi:deoxyribodipyrimidine photo-lyase